MRTSTIILFLLVAFNYTNASVNTINQVQRYQVTLSGNNGGEYNHTHTRSLSDFPIQVFLDGTSLYCEILSSIPDLTVILMKEGKEIENELLSVDAGQCEVIDLSGHGQGSYQVIFTTPQGTYLCGEFSL